MYDYYIHDITFTAAHSSCGVLASGVVANINCIMIICYVWLSYDVRSLLLCACADCRRP